MADRLPFLVHLEGPVDVVHLGDRSQAAGKQRIPNDHIPEIAPLPRPVLGQPFRNPQRRRFVLRHPIPALDLAYPIKSEDVDQLVVQHPLEFGQRPAQRQGDSPLEEFGEAAHSLGQQIGDDVGLLKVDVRGIDDQRNAALHRVPELPLQVGVPLLGHVRGVPGQLLLLGEEVHVEVGRLHLLPAEVGKLHLVLAKVVELSLGWAGDQQQEQEEEK